MPQFADDIFLGTATCGGSFTSAGPAPMTTGVGPMGRTYTYDIVPVTLQTAGVAASQNPGSGASFILTAGTGVTTGIDSAGNTTYIFDYPRCVTVTAAGINTATYLITGYDVYGQRMTATVAAPSTSTVATTKAFKSVISVTNNNATASTNGVTVGFNDKFGLPYRCTDAGYIIRVGWAGVLAADTGTFVAADTTDPATASTTDVRGCYTPSSAANGSRRLIIAYAIPALGSGPSATRVGAFGVTQA